MTDTPERPMSNDDRERWQVYWTAQGMPWRTEPEIDEERQRFLAERRAVKPDIKKGVYPFRDENSPIKLARADVEWLLATHDSGRGPVVWTEERGKPSRERRWGLDLHGADLSQLNLRALPLARMRGGLEGSEWQFASSAQREWAAAHLEGSSNMLGELHLEGVILAGAHLEAALLDGDSAEEFIASLEQANLMGAHLEWTRLSHVHLEKAVFAFAHLEGANLWDAYLQGASFQAATLAGTELVGAHLEQASLWHAHLEGKRMSRDDLRRIQVWSMDFPEVLFPADLRRAYFDVDTTLNNTTLGDAEFDYVAVLGVRWGSVDFSAVVWRTRHDQRKWWRRPKSIILGDEREARRGGIDGRPRWEAGAKVGIDLLVARVEFAARANRQLATVLRAQGLNDEADHFTYRAHLLQRELLRRQHHYLRTFGSWLLDLTSGYGYRPMRSVVTYLAVVLGFAAAYFILRDNVHPALSPLDAVIFSITSFHGRGFSPGESVTLHNPLTIFAAIEAIIGLLIEITFIATFTQRFFAR